MPWRTTGITTLWSTVPPSRYYTMTERDGKFYQRRHQIGFDGKETNIVEEQADFVIGSGNHARSYLHRAPEGKLVELPVSWYAEEGGHWAMSPGYDRAGPKRLPPRCSRRLPVLP